MTTFDLDDVFLSELVAHVRENTGRPCWPIAVPAGDTPGLEPDVPYAIAQPIGGTWDRGRMFTTEHTDARIPVQFTSFGKGIDREGKADFLWLAGKIRGVFDQGNVSGTGWVASLIESEGLPIPADVAGELRGVHEDFTFYVTTG